MLLFLTEGIAALFSRRKSKRSDSASLMVSQEKGHSTDPDKPHHHHHHAHHEHELVPDIPVPIIESPMVAWDPETNAFSERHEASTLELFFDLFFVANLATFTQYHAIIDRDSFWSYIAFFAILWMTWFHVVLFDARWAADCLWERICKVVHFCVFAGFALVGYKFVLLDPKTPHWVYRVLCWILFISRVWLAIQYLIVTIFCSLRKNRYLRLTLPLALNTAVFLVTAAIFGGLVGGFSNVKQNLTGVLVALYVCIVLEMVGPLVISCVWTKLSFKATHVGERLGLLGLIIIGEGVIGTTKTVTRIMGKDGPYVEGIALIFCIILILTFIWILYYDNLPKYRFDPIKQQFWMLLHLPMQLAILGVAEGSQHIALARYYTQTADKFLVPVWWGCYANNLEGQALKANITLAIDYLKLNESRAAGKLALMNINNQLDALVDNAKICAPSNLEPVDNGIYGLPLSMTPFLNSVLGGIYSSIGLDIEPKNNIDAAAIGVHSFRIVYTYYWAAIILLLFCLTVSAILADRGIRLARFRITSLIARTVVSIFSTFALAHGLSNWDFYAKYISSAWILPTVTLLFWIVCVGDRISKFLRRRKEKKEAKYEVAPRHSSDETMLGVESRDEYAHTAQHTV